jgi:hypothetical protein
MPTCPHWRGTRADLVEACLMDFHEAIDGAAEIASRHGLTRSIGIDGVQAIIAAAFRKVRDDLAREA